MPCMGCHIYMGQYLHRSSSRHWIANLNCLVALAYDQRYQINPASQPQRAFGEFTESFRDHLPIFRNGKVGGGRLDQSGSAAYAKNAFKGVRVPGTSRPECGGGNRHCHRYRNSILKTWNDVTP